MNKRISDLKIGDTIEINGKYFDVYDEPSKLDNGDYLFAIVNHGEIDKVRNMTYITPAHLSYELSSNFFNKEVFVVNDNNDIHCIDCEYLMFSDCYGECSKGYKGIVQPNDCCGKGKLKIDQKSKNI